MSDVGRYRRIRSRLWLEREFQALSEGEQLVALYCYSGPYTNGLGLYRLVPEAAAADFPHISADTFKRRFDAACRAFNWRFDAAVRVIWIPAWLGDNSPQSPNVVKSWRSAFNEVPYCAVKAEAATAIQAFLKDKGEAFIEAFGEVLPEAFGNSFGIREQEQEPFLKPSQKHEQKPFGKNGDGPVVHAFIARFCERFTHHNHGATYMLRKPMDVVTVRRLLQVYSAERLEAMAELLLTVNDSWIASTDRGIGILSTKASWLDGRVNGQGVRHVAPLSESCTHTPTCTGRNDCRVLQELEQARREASV